MNGAGYIVVRLRPEASEGTAEGSNGPNAAVEALRAGGFDVRPLYEGADDPDARRSFYVPAEGLDDPESAARSIASFDEVEAAYFTPAGEEP